jgi:hypothetical protein
MLRKRDHKLHRLARQLEQMLQQDQEQDPVKINNLVDRIQHLARSTDVQKKAAQSPTPRGNKFSAP